MTVRFGVKNVQDALVKVGANESGETTIESKAESVTKLLNEGSADLREFIAIHIGMGTFRDVPDLAEQVRDQTGEGPALLAKADALAKELKADFGAIEKAFAEGLLALGGRLEVALGQAVQEVFANQYISTNKEGCDYSVSFPYANGGRATVDIKLDRGKNGLSIGLGIDAAGHHTSTGISNDVDQLAHNLREEIIDNLTPESYYSGKVEAEANIEKYLRLPGVFAGFRDAQVDGRIQNVGEFYQEVSALSDRGIQLLCSELRDADDKSFPQASRLADILKGIPADRKAYREAQATQREARTAGAETPSAVKDLLASPDPILAKLKEVLAGA